MDLKLTNFIDITIKNHAISNSTGTYDTAALLYYVEGATSTINPTYYTLTDNTNLSAELTGIKTYIDCFFNNGGSKLYVIKSDFGAYANSQTSGGSYTPTSDVVHAELEKLSTNVIMVGVTGVTANTNYEVLFRSIFAAYNTKYDTEKIYQKIFVCEIPYLLGTTADLANYIDIQSKKVVSLENYVLKYGKQGVGAAVLAYYTKINVFTTNATQDYAFTTEVFDETIEGYVFKSNDIVTEAMLLDMNIVTKLASQIKNLGGNDTAGYDLTNQFMLLVLHQTLTNSLINLLASKIKYNNTASALVLNNVISVLNQFVSNGYLTQGEAWTDSDLYYEGFKIISKDEVLTNGYKVCMLPFSTLTPTEKANRQLPKIFVLIADSYPIRKIVISGEVF